MLLFEVSEELILLENKNDDDIFLFSQFFIHSDTLRTYEIKYCLKKNVENPNIKIIYLLNERIYTDEELGVSSSKIIQINIKNRLTFKDIFDYVEILDISGYILFANSDIFFNESLQKLRYSELAKKKIFIGLLRYDYKDSSDIKLSGPRSNSQDTWILHSNFNIKKSQRKVLKFNFGKPGCDNKILYIMKILGYHIINCPEIIKSLHVHNTEIRNYSPKDVVSKPWMMCYPRNVDISNDFRIDVYNETKNLTKFNFNDNLKLYSYLKNKMDSGEKFIIPRIAGVENQLVFMAQSLQKNVWNSLGETKKKNLLNIISNKIPIMKNNAGIMISNFDSVYKYSQLYLEAFQNCEIYSNWEAYGDVYRYTKPSQDFINSTFKNKDTIWAFTYDIFNYIYNNPWTLSLTGKRILIISSFIESYKEKIDIRKEIYGIDLFPNCEFVFLKGPQTNGSNPSKEFNVELDSFTKRLYEIKDDFDVALVSCGGYGNLICNNIFKMGKSSIYVGGVLQMYFGVYGTRWLRERKDIMKLFLNKYWSRPKNNEKPENYKNIEGNCYW